MAADLPLLHRRFPQLAATLPHVRLGAGPSPVRPLAGAGEGIELWLKDEGCYGRAYGGNKVRKLEWTLADALHRRRRTVLTLGALATNHGLATATYARELGLETALVLVDQPLDDHVRAQLARLRASGAAVHVTHGTARTVAALPWLIARHTHWPTCTPPYYLPVGGSSPLGLLGPVEVALELGEQVAAGALPEPAHVVVPVGSGGTAAGLLLGLRLAGLRTRVTGVLVNDRMRLDAPRLVRRAQRTLTLLRSRGAAVPAGIELDPADLRVPADWLGAGYGHRTPQAEVARERLAVSDGLALDPVYGAKAMAGLLALVRDGGLGDGPVLFLGTLDALSAG